ncbi:MAG: SMC family ATPase [archaeon]
MIIKSVRLHNIRSYLDELLEFSVGSVMLSGDIGSGKSTVLLAIEFALFGTKRTQLPGSSLLRQGKNEGYVELRLDLGGKDITIMRKLSRSRDAVKQESGYIIQDGVMAEGTAIELKSKIMQLLGYPKDLVSKSKDLVYRYTVYTPQEDMKQILTESKEVRLDTLRRVFQIDKYRRIKDNSGIIVTWIRERLKEMAGRIADLEDKKAQKERLTKNLAESELKLYQLRPRIDDVNAKLAKCKEDIARIEGQIVRLNELRRELATLEVELRNKAEASMRSSVEIRELEVQTAELKKELGGKPLDPEAIKDNMRGVQEQIDAVNENLADQGKTVHECRIKIAQSREIQEKITRLDSCPLCRQNVTEDHKRQVAEAETGKVHLFEKDLHRAGLDEAGLKTRLVTLKDQIEALRKQEREADVVTLRGITLTEKEGRRAALQQQQAELKAVIGRINADKIRINEELHTLSGSEEIYNKMRSCIEQIRESEKQLLMQKAATESEISGIRRVIEDISKEIEDKKKIKQKISEELQVKNWMESHFVGLVGLMEKQVMLKVYHEFNELFQKWFNILIEDETISVRLDEEFTPTVMQNDYETDVSSLSGGERTSLALAYRLSLNKVVNDFVGNIMTHDLIILDEPTDGFSTEQLDKVRDVLDELNASQAIIVSHESKIEGFVDSVIRISKSEHVSRVHKS